MRLNSPLNSTSKVYTSVDITFLSVVYVKSFNCLGKESELPKL